MLPEPSARKPPRLRSIQWIVFFSLCGIAVALALWVVQAGRSQAAGPWARLLYPFDVAAYVNVAGLRSVPAVRAVFTAFAPDASPPHLVEAFAAGTFPGADLREIYATFRFASSGGSSGRIAALLRGRFESTKLYRSLKESGALLVTRPFGSYQVHRLRTALAVPPELVVLNPRECLLCDAQTTGELLGRPPHSPGSEQREVEVPPAALIFATGKVRTSAEAASGGELRNVLQFELLVARAHGGRLECTARLSGDGSLRAIPSLVRSVLQTLTGRTDLADVIEFAPSGPFLLVRCRDLSPLLVAVADRAAAPRFVAPRGEVKAEARRSEPR